MPRCQHVDGVAHDCAYVDWRDSLVPLAEAVADVEVPRPAPGFDDDLWSRRWDAAYHRAMARLVAEGRR